MDQNFNNQNNNQTNDYQNQYNQYNQPQQNDYNNQYAQPQQNGYNNQYAQPQQNDYNNQYAQPQQYNEPYYNQQYPQYVEPSNGGNGMSLASLILGIASVVVCCLAEPLGVLGIIFGCISRKRQPQNNAKATVGIILSIVGLVLSIFFWIAYFVILAEEMSYLYY